jgi:hypothetical protein
MASVLAMLFLVLFSTLAIGFYVAATMSSQIAGNEQSLALAQAGAEAGAQYLRYQFNQMTIPPNPPDLLTAVANAMGPSTGLGMNGTSVMNGGSVAVTNGAIYIPSQNGWTNVDSTTGVNTKFRATIIASGAFLVCNVEGASPAGIMKKAIQLKYQTAPKAGAILNYGVANEGTVSTGGSTVIQGLTDPTKGSVLSANMTSPTPVVVDGTSVSGDLSIVNPSAAISVGASTSVGGTTDPTQIPKHEHIGVPSPTFPTIDTSVFTQYATTLYNSSMTTLTNVYIPPNTNPKFTANITIYGVLWIQQPNTVSFRGNVTICGIIVGNPPSMIQTYDPVNNQISFAGNVQATTIDQLPTTVPNYAAIQKLTGSFMLCPSFAVSFTGNFGTVGGSIVAGSVSMTGNAGGTVDGSVIGMTDNPLTLNGHSSITISSTGTTNYPSGMSFGNSYTPLPGTYLEVTPW